MRDYLHEIPKETLTVKNIKQDIKHMYKMNIVPVLLLGFLSWLMLVCAKELWEDIKIAAIFLCVVALMGIVGSVAILFLPLMGRKITSKKLVIVEDWLVDIREDIEYRHRGPDRPYYEFQFAKGSRYRLYPDIYGDNNYKWSKIYAMSNQGIYNYSQIDDDFYLVFSNEKKNNLILIYNKKLFELKEN